MASPHSPDARQVCIGPCARACIPIKLKGSRRSAKRGITQGRLLSPPADARQSAASATGRSSDTANGPCRTFPGPAKSTLSSTASGRIGDLPQRLRPSDGAPYGPYRDRTSDEGSRVIGSKHPLAGGDVQVIHPITEQHEPATATELIRGDRQPHKPRGVVLARSYAQVVAEGIPRKTHEAVERKSRMYDFAGEHDLRQSPDYISVEEAVARADMPTGYEASTQQSEPTSVPQSQRRGIVNHTRQPLADSRQDSIPFRRDYQHQDILRDSSIGVKEYNSYEGAPWTGHYSSAPRTMPEVSTVQSDASRASVNGSETRYDTVPRSHFADDTALEHPRNTESDHLPPADWSRGHTHAEWEEAQRMTEMGESATYLDTPWQDNSAAESPISPQWEDAMVEQGNPYYPPGSSLSPSMSAGADAWQDVQSAQEPCSEHPLPPIFSGHRDVPAANGYGPYPPHSQDKRQPASVPDEVYSAPSHGDPAGVQLNCYPSQADTHLRNDVGPQAVRSIRKRDSDTAAIASATRDSASNPPTSAGDTHQQCELQDLTELSRAMKKPRTSNAHTAPAALQKPSFDDFLKTCKLRPSKPSSVSAGAPGAQRSGLEAFMALRGAVIAPIQPQEISVEASQAKQQRRPGAWLKHPAIQNPGWYRKAARQPVDPQNRRSALASMVILRDRRLFRALDDAGLELIETLDDTQPGDLVLSTDTAVLIRSLQQVTADPHKIKNDALVAAVLYHWVIVVVKSVPFEDLGGKAVGDQSADSEDPLTDSALAELGRLKRAIAAIAEPDGKRIGRVEVVFANHGPSELAGVLRCVMQEEEDAFEREHGDEKADVLWRERTWVQRDEDESERALVHECGINSMSANFILHIAGSLDRLADLSPAKRSKAFAPIIGQDVATRLNEALRRKESARARNQAPCASASTSHSSPYM